MRVEVSEGEPQLLEMGQTAYTAYTGPHSQVPHVREGAGHAAQQGSH